MKLHLLDGVFFYPIMSKQAYLLFIFFISLNFIHAQTKVGGVVHDDTGATVPFANVVFANSTSGTTTNEDGDFYLQAEGNFDTLVVSFLGYKTLKVPLKSSVNLNMKITLEQEAASLG